MSQLHVVHYNSDKYSSFHEAKEKQDGLAVLAFFYEVSLAVTIFFNAFVLFNDSFFIIIVVQCCHLMGVRESKLSSKEKEKWKWKMNIIVFVNPLEKELGSTKWPCIAWST